jgi:hypothetical protein
VTKQSATDIEHSESKPIIEQGMEVTDFMQHNFTDQVVLTEANQETLRKS